MPKTVICFFAIIILPGIIFADEELFRSTLPLDISTSDYYELEAWCERLGIQSSGTRRELEDRLRKHYGLESPVRTLETEEGKSILIESAYSLEYFTLDVIDEKYIRLSGGVVLTLEDSTSSVTHEIRADSIVLNQETNSLTASGNLEYVLTRDGNTEVFRGDSLTFDTESLEGVFFEGISERERKTEDKKIIFYYSGDTIYRSEDNVVTLEDGVITSSKRFPPNYSIRASKIWVLAPGEWAILNAVLNIGRIPVFYIPAFFRPGDPLFFHPALGYRRREGYFVQTTTYLLGKQKEDGDDTTISFLQTLGTEDIERSVNGLFLREQESVTPAQRKFRNYADKTGSYFKVLLDVYSRLGYLVGIDGEIKDLGFLKNLTISAALGRSRQIFETASGYTPLYETEDGTFESMWDSSYLLNLDLPFRYGIDFDFLLNAGSLSLSGKVPAFSDPYFEEDFMDRRERTDWSELIGIETGESTETATTVQQSSVWNLKASWNPAVKTLNPYIDTLSLKTLEASMYWKSRELEVENEENRYFFYPDSIMLPDTTGTLKGVIFSTSFPRSGRAGTEENEEKRVVQGLEIRSPWETGETATEEEEEDDEGPIRAPEMREDGKLEVLQYIIPFQHSLAYAFTPDFSFNTKLNSDNWEVPEDILYDPLYSLLSGQGSLLATYNANLYEDLLSMRVVQNVSVQQKVHYPGEGLSESDKQTYERQDRDSTFIRLNESFLLTSRPLLGMEMMKTSLASYSLKFLAYERSYDENIEDFTDFFTEWTDDYIQEHKLQMDLLFRPETWRNSLGILLQLPPLEREVTLSSQLETGPLITTLRWTIAEDENDLLAAEPFIFRERIRTWNRKYNTTSMRQAFPTPLPD